MSVEKNIIKLTELRPGQGVEPKVGALSALARTSSMLHSQSVLPTGIPGRFSSSLLPPLFPLGRCAAIFIQRGVANGGIPRLPASHARRSIA
jgi:hypothetical protein